MATGGSAKSPWLVAVVALILLATKGAAGQTVGEEASSRVPPAAPAVAAPFPLVFEARTGFHAPLGIASFALAYDRGGMFSGGVGMGAFAWTRESVPPLAVFVRGRFLRVGAFAFGASATLSREHNVYARTYQRQPAESFAPEQVTWTWDPGYRATGALVAEAAGNIWSLRIEAGVARELGSPRCHFEDGGGYFEGDCNSSQIPAAYHLDIEPGRWQPSLSAAVALHLGSPSSAPSGYRSPSVAASLSLAGLAVPLVAALAMKQADHTERAMTWAVVGLSVGPSLGHVYAGEFGHAFGFAAARCAALVGGVILAFSPAPPVGFAALAAVPILVIYDLVDAPRAAQRANALHGVSLVPFASTSGPAPSQGMAVVGTF